MKYLKKFFVSFVMIFAVLFTFSACGKNNPPPEEEMFETDALTMTDYEAFLENNTHKITGGFLASITTSYADGTTDSAVQKVLIGIDRVKCSLEVSGTENYTSYLNDDMLYYDGADKLYSYVEDFTSSATESFKTRRAYEYMMSVIYPSNSVAYKIYDGSIFENIETIYEDLDATISIKKLYNSKHTNIVVTVELSESEKTTYTLQYTDGSFSGIEVKIKTAEMLRKATIQTFDGQISLPQNLDTDFSNERAGGETADDNWSPTD